mmetsp:Transcript_15946/g.48010  ORF Transcript_15946/g.48010 Transcript_15946/m.48010 type:complete len:216 (-) Transcript_15946:1147-1794(-)
MPSSTTSVRVKPSQSWCLACSACSSMVLEESLTTQRRPRTRRPQRRSRPGKATSVRPSAPRPTSTAGRPCATPTRRSSLTPSGPCATRRPTASPPSSSRAWAIRSSWSACPPAWWRRLRSSAGSRAAKREDRTPPASLTSAWTGPSAWTLRRSARAGGGSSRSRTSRNSATSSGSSTQTTTELSPSRIGQRACPFLASTSSAAIAWRRALSTRRR